MALLAHPGVGGLGAHLGVVVGELKVAALRVGLGVRPEIPLLPVRLHDQAGRLHHDYVLGVKKD